MKYKAEEAKNDSRATSTGRRCKEDGRKIVEEILARFNDSTSFVFFDEQGVYDPGSYSVSGRLTLASET